MKMHLVVIANNTNSNIDLSPLYPNEEQAYQELEDQFKSAVENYFGEGIAERYLAEGRNNSEEPNDYEESERSDLLGETDEVSISDQGFVVYYSKTSDLTYGTICTLEIPEPERQYTAMLAAHVLNADDRRARARAFATCLDRLRSDNTYLDRGFGMLAAIRDNDLNAFVTALTGWNIADVMKAAHIWPDTDHTFSQTPVEATLFYYNEDGRHEANCKVDLATHEVFDIFPADSEKVFEEGMEYTEELKRCTNIRVRFADYGSYYCYAKEALPETARDIGFWYKTRKEMY